MNHCSSQQLLLYRKIYQCRYTCSALKLSQSLIPSPNAPAFVSNRLFHRWYSRFIHCLPGSHFVRIAQILTTKQRNKKKNTNRNTTNNEEKEEKKKKERRRTIAEPCSAMGSPLFGYRTKTHVGAVNREAGRARAKHTTQHEPQLPQYGRPTMGDTHYFFFLSRIKGDATYEQCCFQQV